MCYHNIYKSWSWLGGHADGDPDLLHVALKEVEEESGVKAKAVMNDIFSIEILTVNGHIKRGAYVPSHLHMNVTYLLEADENATLHMKADENSGVRWFDHEEVLTVPNEEWMVERVYKKLEERLKRGEY
jgi:ADP-ribose pyrophosphatase YjhB (NUDIX family)